MKMHSHPAVANSGDSFGGPQQKTFLGYDFGSFSSRNRHIHYVTFRPIPKVQPVRLVKSADLDYR